MKRNSIGPLLVAALSAGVLGVSLPGCGGSAGVNYKVEFAAPASAMRGAPVFLRGRRIGHVASVKRTRGAKAPSTTVTVATLDVMPSEVQCSARQLAGCALLSKGARFVLCAKKIYVREKTAALRAPSGWVFPVDSTQLRPPTQRRCP